MYGAAAPIAHPPDHVRGHRGHVFNERCDEIANGFARGRPPELRSGDGAWIAGAASASPTSPVGLPPGVNTPFYLSLRDGELRLHPDWADCEAWVKGAKKTRYKRIRSATELGDTLAGWGLDLDAARQQLGY